MSEKTGYPTPPPAPGKRDAFFGQQNTEDAAGKKIWNPHARGGKGGYTRKDHPNNPSRRSARSGG